MAEKKHTSFDAKLSKANLCAMVLLVGVVWVGVGSSALSRGYWFITQPPVDIAKQHAVREFIDPNTATVPSLQRLRGIGPTRAQGIVDYRKQHGPQVFNYPADLEKVHGIGPQTVKKNLRYLTFPSPHDRKQQ